MKYGTGIFHLSSSTRLSLNYKSELYEIKVSAQDVRVWGEVEQLQDNASVNIHEAWARMKFSEQLGLKLGRQELVYDDQRLLGSVNWTQQARSHDALVVQFGDPESDLQIDLGGSYNQEAENVFGNSYTLSNYKVLSYLWLNKAFGYFDASALFLTDGFEQQTGQTNFRYTYGTDLNYNRQRWNVSGSAYYQQGDDGSRRNISAYMLAAEVSYNLDFLQFRTGYDYLSGGNANDINPARNTFHTLYATNHKFYGNMDYFLNIPVDTRGGGLQDLYLGTNYKVTEDFNAGLTYHSFALANEISDPQNITETLDQYLGSEFDLNFSYQFTDEITFNIGYATLFGSTSLNHLQLRDGKTTEHWGWAMVVLTPEIIQ
ncbi:MAG: alginate export family protein [Balneolaceae bacterium]|nr:alginate export family protein [Balneolaceae bacterium]